MNLTKRISLFGIVTGLLLASMLVSWSVVLAQTETTAENVAAPADIPQELVPLAKDLGCQTLALCAEKFDADIETGITLAQKHNIYTPEQKKVAITFKTEVLERLRTVSQDNFEEEILALADKILREKPSLAKTMGLTRQEVSAAETVISTIKDAGVDIAICQKSPDNLSREQLIACVKAGNDLSSRGALVLNYIPKGNTKAEEAKRMLDLENSLLAGEYSGLGRIGFEEAGQICLKPGSESVTDCDRIAERFFGALGVRHLQEARQQTTRAKEYYTEGFERMELMTPDGQKLIGKEAIKNTCDRAFEKNDLVLARACGNFAVKNGYATEKEIEEGLKLLETFSQKAEGVDFDDCRFDPESCREFLPDEFRSRFDSQFEIFKIMSGSIGFDPSRCENTYDSDIGKRCLEGAKGALSRVEEIAKDSPEARRIVDEIKSRINEGERMTERLNEFHQDSSLGGMTGPGGCKGGEECFKYCSQPANSAECISFGAKNQIFDQNTAIQKFNFVNKRLDNPHPEFAKPEKEDYKSLPNRPYPEEFEEDQINRGFNRYPSQYPRYSEPYPPQQPAGPSKECSAAIESGDFVKAKTACSNITDTYERNYPRLITEPFPVCPAYSMPSPCPEGQMRQQTSDVRGCPTSGACIAIENYKPIEVKSCPVGTYWSGTSCVANPEQNVKNVCPMMPTVSVCPDGQEQYVTYNSPECGKYYGCRNTTINAPCPTGTYWDDQSCIVQKTAKECPAGMWWDGIAQSCKSFPVQTVGSCDYSTQYWRASTSECQPRINCHDTLHPEYNSPECQGVRGGNTTTTCPSGQYWNGTVCVTSTTNNNYGTDPSTGCTQAGGTWNTSTNYCQMPTIGNTTCPSGQYWNGTACVSSSTTTTSGSSATCSSGEYWNGTSCVTSPSPSSDPATMCAQAGGIWDGNTCQTAMLWCNQSGGNWTGAACNLAKNISDQKAYYDYYQRQTNPLLAQVIRAFVDLFR